MDSTFSRVATYTGLSNPIYETQLDYVLSNARWREAVKNCRAKKSHQLNRHGEQFDRACLECSILFVYALL